MKNAYKCVNFHWKNIDSIVLHSMLSLVFLHYYYYTFTGVITLKKPTTATVTSTLQLLIILTDFFLHKFS